MIFVTVGTQAPFDRLIKAIDSIAANLDEPVIAQALNGSYEPKHIETLGFLTPKEFDEYFNSASLVIAHAGMGTIISALTKNKPLVIFPRRASLGEHRNEHQMATARRLGSMKLTNVALEENDLQKLIVSRRDLKPCPTIGESASQGLIDSISSFILGI